MKQNYIVLILTLLITGISCFDSTEIFAQSKLAKDETVINGRVLDSLELFSIQDALIINKRTNKIATTDKEGYFYVSLKPTDTLILYMVGYFPKLLHFSENDLKKQLHLYYMKRNMQEIREVEIIAKKEAKEKEYKFPFNQEPATAESPITMLYEKFSRRYKQYRKIEELEKIKYYEQLRRERLRKSLIVQVTDLKEDEVEDFLKFAYFTDEYIETASEYELIIAIKKRYQEYIKR
ncbi:MAG TPA: hypothetical protein VIK89_10340 [Cytophagaceae bacterium]